jgi:hypothetical protein
LAIDPTGRCGRREFRHWEHASLQYRPEQRATHTIRSSDSHGDEP